MSDRSEQLRHLAHLIDERLGPVSGAIADRSAVLMREAAAAIADLTRDLAKVTADYYPSPPHGWTCFHCGENFVMQEAARLHFGGDQGALAGCQIKGQRGLLNTIREQEVELDRYRGEDSDKDRQMHAISADHVVALRREEEKGYARGLRDERERALRIIDRVKSGLRNGGARNACAAIASDLNEGCDG